jgi:hypothetical protein
MCLSNVVLPEPRNPDNRVTGRRVSVESAIATDKEVRRTSRTLHDQSEEKSNKNKEACEKKKKLGKTGCTTAYYKTALASPPPYLCFPSTASATSSLPLASLSPSLLDHPLVLPACHHLHFIQHNVWSRLGTRCSS